MRVGDHRPGCSFTNLFFPVESDNQNTRKPVDLFQIVGAGDRLGWSAGHTSANWPRPLGEQQEPEIS